MHFRTHLVVLTHSQVGRCCIGELFFGMEEQCQNQAFNPGLDLLGRLQQSSGASQTPGGEDESSGPLPWKNRNCI